MRIFSTLAREMQGRPSTWSRVATFSAGSVLLVTVASADGGFFRETWVWISLACSTLTGIALVARDRIAVGRLELLGLAALSLFACWTALSTTWSPTPEATIEEAERALVYVGGFLAFAVVVERDALRAYFAGLAVAITLVVAYSMGDRLLDPPTGSDPTQGTLLIEPFGYANALGIFATIGLLLSLGLAACARARMEATAWLTPALVLTPALIRTESRGAWFALAVGLCVLAACRWQSSSFRAPFVWAVIAALACVALAAAVLVVVHPTSLIGPRADYWAVAWREWQENVWLGSGAGTFALYWLREGNVSAVLDAHSLYLETLAEVGPLGLSLLVAVLAIPLVAAVRVRACPLAAAGAGAYAAFLVHAGLDWDWEMPAVTLAGLLCGIGILAADRREATEVTIGLRGRCALALVALVIASLAVVAAVAH
jgi:O-antigen ligase